MPKALESYGRKDGLRCQRNGAEAGDLVVITDSRAVDF